MTAFFIEKKKRKAINFQHFAIVEVKNVIKYRINNYFTLS